MSSLLITGALFHIKISYLINIFFINTLSHYVVEFHAESHRKRYRLGRISINILSVACPYLPVI
jgi:hypothetical protein